MDAVTQNQHKVLCEVLTHSGQSVEDRNGQSDTEPRTVKCEVPTEIGGL